MDEHLEPDLDALDEMQLQSMRYNVKNDSVTKREVLDSDLFDIRWDGEKNEFTLSTDQLELLGKFYEAEEGYVRLKVEHIRMKLRSLLMAMSSINPTQQLYIWLKIPKRILTLQQGYIGSQSLSKPSLW